MNKPSIWPSRWLAVKERYFILILLFLPIFLSFLFFLLGEHELIIKIIVMIYLYFYFPLYLFDKDMLPAAGTFSFEEDDVEQQVGRTVTAFIALIVYFGVLIFF